MKKSDESLSVLLVTVSCLMIGIATKSALIGLGMWSCVGGMMICIKGWIREEKERSSAGNQ